MALLALQRRAIPAGPCNFLQHCPRRPYCFGRRQAQRISAGHLSRSDPAPATGCVHRPICDPLQLLGTSGGSLSPGVAVISSVPGGGHAAWDGTALAAAHVTGFGALLLAHHPMFQAGGAFSARGQQRTSALFEFIRAAAVPYIQVDPLRVGAGLPDLQQVPAMLPPAGPRLDPSSLLQSAHSVFNERQASGHPVGYGPGLATSMALMQLRAAGLLL